MRDIDNQAMIHASARELLDMMARNETHRVDNLRTNLPTELYFGRGDVAIGWTHDAMDRALGMAK